MPKTNHAGSTFAGHQGVVDHADGKLSELDPSRNLDGSVVDGYESEDRELKDLDPETREGIRADSTAVGPIEDEKADEEESADDASSEEASDEKPAPAKRTRAAATKK